MEATSAAGAAGEAAEAMTTASETEESDSESELWRGTSRQDRLDNLLKTESVTVETATD